MESSCMSCKFFKIEDTMSGYCRVEVREAGDQKAPRPMVKLGDICEKWADCGQQYYIRLGWIRSQEKRKENEPLQ